MPTEEMKTRMMTPGTTPDSELAAAYEPVDPVSAHMMYQQMTPLQRAHYLESMGYPQQAAYYQGVAQREGLLVGGVQVAASGISSLAAALPTGEERVLFRELDALRAKEPGLTLGELYARRAQVAAAAGRHAAQRRKHREAIEATTGGRTSAAAQTRLRGQEAQEETQERAAGEALIQQEQAAVAAADIAEERRLSQAKQAKQLRGRQAFTNLVGTVGSVAGQLLGARTPLTAEAAEISKGIRRTKQQVPMIERGIAQAKERDIAFEETRPGRRLVAQAKRVARQQMIPTPGIDQAVTPPQPAVSPAAVGQPTQIDPELLRSFGDTQEFMRLNKAMQQKK